jgi:hypothetical protein
MRKLITKFMHINVGIGWTEDRIPDDVQKSINSNNTDTTYLYNVDFIKLKDILLSESYAKDRDALIKELKTSDKATFRREEIRALIPTSNWEKYFSAQVKSDSEELSSLWSRLYELRCRVAHNKSFTLSDLNETKKLTKQIDPILEAAIGKLDEIHVDKDEVQDIVDDVVSNAARGDSVHKKAFVLEYRKLERLVFDLTTPLQPPNEERKRRTFLFDVTLLRGSGYINDLQYKKIRSISAFQNRLVHTMSDQNETDDWEARVGTVREVNAHLKLVSDSKERTSPAKTKTK